MLEQFDAPWKVAVERFLQPLLQLCFPAVHEVIDWRQPPEFLDTELEGQVRHLLMSKLTLCRKPLAVRQASGTKRV